jgi:hypothetical protein
VEEDVSVSSPAAAPSSLKPTVSKFPLAKFGNRDIHVDPNARIEQIFSWNRTGAQSPFLQFVNGNGDKNRRFRKPGNFGSALTETRFIPSNNPKKSTSLTSFNLDSLSHNFIDDLRPSRPLVSFKSPDVPLEPEWVEKILKDTEYLSSDSEEGQGGYDDHAAEILIADVNQPSKSNEGDLIIPDEEVPGRFWDKRPWRPMPPFLRPGEKHQGPVYQLGQTRERPLPTKSTSTTTERPSSTQASAKTFGKVERPFYGGADDPRLASTIFAKAEQESNEIDRAISKTDSQKGEITNCIHFSH